MKEYQSKTGGRHLFNEDLQNLQELALSMTTLFEDCGLNFVITGCKISSIRTNAGYSYNVTAGYCYLNGKVRYVPARSLGLVSLPFYICESNITQGNQIAYADGSSDEEFIEYAALVKHSKETVSGSYIASEDMAFPNLRTAFFASYSLVKSSAIRQYIDSLITFNKGLTSTALNIISGSNTGDIKIDGSGNINILLSKSGNSQFILKFIKTSGNIELYDGNKKVWTISSSDGKLYLPTAKVDNLEVTNKATFKDLDIETFKASKKVASKLYDVLNDKNKTVLQVKPMTVNNVEGVAIVSNISGNRETTYFFGNDSIGFYTIDGGATLSIIKNGLYYNADFTAEHLKSNQDIYEKGQKLSDVYVRKMTDSDWIPLVNMQTGGVISDLKIRNKWDIQLTIKGSIPRALINVPQDYNRQSTSHEYYYKYPLGIYIPTSVSLPTQEVEIGSQYYIGQTGYQTIQIPTNPKTKMLLAFVAKLTNCYMSEHGGDTDAWCVLGIGRDRQIYLCGARFIDYCTWSSYQRFYANADSAIEVRVWLD